MKIAFLCGCLEPGHDGVGDYARRLAGELTRQGHQAPLLALNDAAVAGEVAETQADDGVDLLVLRLPAAWPSAKRFERARAWVEQHDPQWLSLQFVLFAYQPRGLPYGLGRRLARLGQGRRWHLMLHELWVGMATNDSLKHRLWGRLQRAIVRNLVQTLQPVVTHTQCTLYLQQLLHNQLAAQRLPLFSNIKVAEPTGTTDYAQHYGIQPTQAVRFVLFGGLHPGASIAALVTAIRQFYAAQNRGFEFWYIGRNGTELAAHLALLAEQGVAHRVFGEQEPADISRLLSLATVGIATGSPEMLEKNGTVAALLDHGLPVLCVGRQLRVPAVGPLPMPAGTYLPTDLLHVLTTLPRQRPPHDLPHVAAQFIHELA